MSIYDEFNELTVEDFKEMSPEEITFWFGIGKRQEEIKQMTKVLVDNAEVKEVEREATTIKVDSKVVN